MDLSLYSTINTFHNAHRGGKIKEKILILTHATLPHDLPSSPIFPHCLHNRAFNFLRLKKQPGKCPLDYTNPKIFTTLQSLLGNRICSNNFQTLLSHYLFTQYLFIFQILFSTIIRHMRPF